MDYKKLNEITVRSQKELNDIPLDFKGKIYIDCFWISVNKKYYYSVEAYGNSSVVAYGNSSVEARDDSSVKAHGNSSVVARDDSSVKAYGNSSVVAYGNSSVEAWDDSSVEARDDSSVEAYGNSSVEARDDSSVEAYGNLSVVARDDSSVKAYGNLSVVVWDDSLVVARGNSSVVARGNSSVVAYGNSSVEARGNSSVEAYGNSSVEARDDSSVEAYGNSQIVDCLGNGKIKIAGNSRIVYNPKNTNDYIDFYGIKHTKTKAILYKAVYKINGIYKSIYDESYIYEIGETYKNKCDTDMSKNCSYGLHASHLSWALQFGSGYKGFVILEVAIKIKDIITPKKTDGKVRTSCLEVIREVPLEECGIYGKILAKRKRENK